LADVKKIVGVVTGANGACPINGIGKRFGLLEVIGRAANDKRGRARWICVCRGRGSGNVIVVEATNLASGRSRLRCL